MTFMLSIGLAIAVCGALGTGVAIAYRRHRRPRYFRSRADVEQALGVPVLASYQAPRQH